GPMVDKIEGLDALREATKGYTPQFVENVTGLSQDLLREAADYLAQSKRPAFIWSPPLGQQLHGVDQIKSLANLALLCGAVADGGGGFHLVGPQSNMVGVVEMGATPSLLPGYRPADGKGLSAVEMFQAASEGRLKALFVMGENPLITLPKSLVQEGLKGLEVLVVQDMFLSETGDEAHVFLPVLSFAEVDGTYTNCEGRVQRLRKGLEPLEGLRWEGDILSDLASFMGKDMKVEVPAGVFEEIKGINPLYKGADFEALGTQLRGDGKGDLLKNAAFRPVEHKQEKAEEGYPFLLSMEGLFYNHLIGSGSQKRAQGLAKASPRPCLEMNAEDARGMGIGNGDQVKVTTPWGEVEIEARGSEAMKRGVLSLYLSCYDVDASQLVSPKLDPLSLVPNYGEIPAKVEKV
ncbi:MAG: molybdopterin-dependent oxidoreductase, partial [Deltaproteobacteria bacterium]